MLTTKSPEYFEEFNKLVEKYGRGRLELMYKFDSKITYDRKERFVLTVLCAYTFLFSHKEWFEEAAGE